MLLFYNDLVTGIAFCRQQYGAHVSILTYETRNYEFKSLDFVSVKSVAIGKKHKHPCFTLVFSRIEVLGQGEHVFSVNKPGYTEWTWYT